MTNLNTPLVSIICATYNHEKFIRECLDGFIMQKTDFLFEILINDDASQDNTVEIIRKYQLKYPQLIKPIYQKDNQYSKGVKPWKDILFPLARGKYIALCEGDDYWTDSLKLQKQINFMESHKEFVMCFHTCEIKVENRAKLDSYLMPLKDILKMKDLLWQHYIPTASLIIRRAAIPNPYPEWANKLIMEDLPLEILVSEKGLTKFFDERMSVYRRNNTSITHSPTHRKKAFKSRCMLYCYLNREFKYKYCHLFLFKLLWFIGGHTKASLYRLLGLIK